MAERHNPDHGRPDEPTRSEHPEPRRAGADDRHDTPASGSRRNVERDRARTVEEARHERFGGANVGAAFFGWLIAVGMALLLTGVLGAVAAGVGESLDLTRSDAAGEADSIGIGAGIALLAVLMIAYYLGGYVAGRMSRYDGGRQGLAVWVFGLVVTVVAAVLGLVFGSEYDVLGRVDLPSIPVPTDALTTAGIVTLVAVLLGTLLAAMLGGKAGHRYHTKVDRYVG